MQYNCYLENNTTAFTLIYSFTQINAQLLSVSQWWSQYFMLQYFFVFFHCTAHMSSTILSAHQTYTVHTAPKHGYIISLNFTTSVWRNSQSVCLVIQRQRVRSKVQVFDHLGSIVVNIAFKTAEAKSCKTSQRSKQMGKRNYRSMPVNAGQHLCTFLGIRLFMYPNILNNSMCRVVNIKKK